MSCVRLHCVGVACVHVSSQSGGENGGAGGSGGAGTAGGVAGATGGVLGGALGGAGGALGGGKHWSTSILSSSALHLLAVASCRQSVVCICPVFG